MLFEIARRSLVVGAALAPLLSAGRSAAKEGRRMLQPRELMWRRVMDELSFEHARIAPGPLGPELSGTVLVAEKGAPLRLDYRITCDSGWRTLEVEVGQTYVSKRRTLRLGHDGEGRWRLDGHEAPSLAGCTDVDLGLSPSTNALPINRLPLRRGETAIIRAAWVRFPGLDVVPAEQSYERLDESRYRYRSIASGFEAVVEVDRDGLPVDYSGVWRRVAEGAATSPSEDDGFVKALLAAGSAAELGDIAADFGWLVGGWEAEVRDFDSPGQVRRASGEWWFAWVLEGRAMQDVWISPKRDERALPRRPLAAKDRYGTTIRRFDRREGVWRITWINPVSGAVNHLAGRREGDRIVLLGEEGGMPMRWSFNEITESSFRWLGESRQTDGLWRTEAEFRLRRIA